MNYADLCHAFYITTRSGGLKKMPSQAKIAKFFIEKAIPEDRPDLLDVGESTFSKWFSGENNPKKPRWDAIKDSFKEKEYAAEIFAALNDKNLKKVVENLGIKIDSQETIVKKKLAHAVARQIYALAQGNGEAENIIPEIYCEEDINADYAKYLKTASKEYGTVILPGGEEVAIGDCYVCNKVCTKPALFPNRISKTGKIIENVSLEAIAELGALYKDSFLIAGEGMGKTLMLQYLFLEAAHKYADTGILPIMVNLMDFTYHKGDLVSCITKAVQQMDSNFLDDDVRKMMEAGKCYLLFDGLDEIDPTDIQEFQRKLKRMRNDYPNNRTIITSRDCDDLDGIHGFGRLYLMPLDEGQSEELIDKLLGIFDDAQSKDKILQYMAEDFISKDGILATNPMLLSYIVIYRDSLDSFYENPLAFYNLLYESLVSGHDKEKTAYKRVFHSVNDSGEFTTVFMEFCGRTYMEAAREFDMDSFGQYYDKLESVSSLINPGKMNKERFRRDVCATACVMYEQDRGIFYVDPGIQHYLFIQYLCREEPQTMKEYGNCLTKYPPERYGSLLPLYMLYERTPEKVEVCILLPFLMNIFGGKEDDEAFLMFLLCFYDAIKVMGVSKKQIEAYCNGEKYMYQVTYNEPSTLLAHLIYTILDIENASFEFSMDVDLGEFEECAESPLAGERTEIVREKDTIPVVSLKDYSRAEFESLNMVTDNYYYQSLIRDSENRVVPFGYVYSIDIGVVLDEPEKYERILNILKKPEHPVRIKYDRVKAYYRRLCKEQKKNAFKTL